MPRTRLRAKVRDDASRNGGLPAAGHKRQSVTDKQHSHHAWRSTMRRMTALAIAIAAFVVLEAPSQLWSGFALAWADFEHLAVEAAMDTAAEAASAMHPAGKLTFRLRLNTPGAQGDIWMMNADGSNPTRVTCTSNPRLTVTAPAWSPNGRTIAFYSAEVVGGPQFIYLIDVTEDCGPGTLLTAGRFPRWSP